MMLLPAPVATQLATAALARQGQYGAVSQLAQAHGLSRPTVYAYRGRAAKALNDAFSPPPDDAPLFTLDIHRADLLRSHIGLRVCAPTSTRDIEDLLPILYDHTWSVSTRGTVVVSLRLPCDVLCRGASSSASTRSPD